MGSRRLAPTLLKHLTTLVYSYRMHFRRTASILALLGVEIAALLALHHLGSYEAAAIGWGDLSTWLAQTPSEDAIVAVVRLAALALAWWLTASTALYILVSATRIPGLARGVRWATIAPVRRMIDAALATTIVVGSTLAHPSLTAATPANRSAVVVELEESGVQAEENPNPIYQPRPAGDPRPGYEPRPASDPPAPPSPSANPTQPTTDSAPRENEPAAIFTAPRYTVRPGDNLWTIAEQHLAAASDQPAIELNAGDVRAHWLRLVQGNTDRFRSGDPDLIRPGEQVELR